MLSERVGRIEPSGIRRIFELMSTMEDPINLSIGQAHYEAPEALVEAACRALRQGFNRYTVTQGLPALNARILDQVTARYGRRPESCLVTSGVSGGIALAFLALLDPGDEILLPDPGFMMYRTLATVLGAVPKFYSTYPRGPGEGGRDARFALDAAELEARITDRTRVLFLNSPSNPTGAVLSRAEVEAACAVADKHGLTLVSDEIYDFFVYDGEFTSPVALSDRCVQLGGFSKTFGVPGWRMGYATGPANVLDAMKTLQQFSFVCAPAPFQHALLDAAFDLDMRPYRDDYRHKRDLVTRELHPSYGLRAPEGSFYAFPRLPAGNTGADFLQAAIDHRLLIVPGKAFSQRDTHFRLSFAADDATLRRGIAVLNELAAGRA
ncbi:MAG: pyridoxal phosphate-dependent aminotransferase [Planctomycetota bacterium]